ncbi:hypothetical protein [Bacillus toyonensis]|uniref:Phage protein n=1 Tax=Bacillus toyonensis TaxID=155322 RepID=A0A2C4QR61_9BACI|nr:hypothetical protein [Bacillus toyonensis]PGA94646.1 hypothetical protein COL93_25325 [Bacillus toyonensis]PHD67527.1 hypothetical protein COF40_19380 [Bacillus toyonensis]
MDVNISVNYKDSEINGFFNEIEQMKRQRTVLKERIDEKTEAIISHIKKYGNVLAYKNDVAHVLSVVGRTSTKFDKAGFAAKVDRPQSELKPIGIAELVEEKRTTSDEMKEFLTDEVKQVLKARKAKKAEIDLLGARAIISI